jgi:hypothetical protein
MPTINPRRWLAAKTIRTFLIPAVLATGTAIATASPASADIVRIQHVSSGRYLDAWENDPTNGTNVVVWTQQNNDTQLWERTHISGDVYTLQQVSNDRFLDAYETDGFDFRAVTWAPQGNDSQRWLMTDLGGGIFRIQQVNTGRYLDAHENSENGFRAVTRTFQNNTTQQWRVIPQLTILIPPLEILSILVPPPAPPIHAQGTFELPSPMMANLDNGATALLQGDLVHNAPDLFNLALTPRNGAQISFTTGAQRGYAGCSAAAWSNASVMVSALSAGDYICFKTDEGRISEFRVTAIGGGLFHPLSISYRTWQ